jgi:hypothetical protein
MAQKTLFQIITQAAAELNLPQPVNVIASQDQNVQKLLYLCRAVADDLLAEHDWQVLQTRYSFTTTAGVDTYAFPTDYERWISGAFFDVNNRWPMQGPKTAIEWEWLKASGSVSPPFTQYRIFGDKIVVAPVPGTSTYTFNAEYVSNAYCRSGAGVRKSDFTADDDTCLFDHRVMVYGVKLKMRESIAQDTTSALSDYKRALEQAKGSDAPARNLNLLNSSEFRQIGIDNVPDGSWS